MRIFSFRHTALGFSAAALLAACGQTQPPANQAPGVMPQISAIRIVPDKYEQNLVGVYGSPDYSSVVEGYKKADAKNGPPACKVTAPAATNDIAVDSNGNLIVPTVKFSVGSYIGDTTVYQGPGLCGRELGSVQDDASQAAPTDAASLNAATGKIVIANGANYTFYDQASISVCTLKAGCTRNLTNPNMHFVVGVALSKDGDCWATGKNYGYTPDMIYFKGCKGSGQLAAGWKNVAPGGLDIDTHGNIVSVDASGEFAAKLWIYRGCNPACTIVGGPFSLKKNTRSIYGHLNSIGTEFIAGDESYSGGLDIYKYSIKGLHYEYSITNGLRGSEGAAFDPGSQQ